MILHLYVALHSGKKYFDFNALKFDPKQTKHTGVFVRSTVSNRLSQMDSLSVLHTWIFSINLNAERSRITLFHFKLKKDI